MALRPDLILLEIDMPKLNGYDRCLRLRGEWWGMEVVKMALTGWARS